MLKVFMMLCIFLQGVALFPHHHHKGNEAICFSIEHCVKPHADFKDHSGCTHSSRCDGHSMQGHKHDSDQSSCAVTKIVVIKPQENSTDGLTAFAFLLTGMSIPSQIPMLVCDEYYTSTILVRNVEGNVPDVESLIVTYISQALPLRAPNVLS